MLIRLICLFMVGVFGWLALLTGSDAAKDTEILLFNASNINKFNF